MRERSRSRATALAVAWLLLLTAALSMSCGRADQGTGKTGELPATPEDRNQQETTSGDGTSSAGTTSEDAAQGEPFTEAPAASGGTEGVADGILEVGFEEREGYERAVVSFGSGGAPASRVPAWALSSPTGEGYARITFPGVDGTGTTDGSFGGSVMDGFYVVRAPEGGLFMDLFATGAFLYRVEELHNPGRLVIDYSPASVPLGFPLPARGARVVLTSPRESEAVSNPLRVSGYSRSFEASNTIVLRDASGNVLSRTTALSNDWAETWGYFETSLEVPPFEGSATLLAGSESPRDGSLEGVEVSVGYGGNG